MTETTAPAAAAPLVADLQEMERQFEALKREARELLEGIDDAQFNWRPEPGRWSMAECIAHLNVTGQSFLPALDRRIREAHAEGRRGAPPFRYTLFGKLVVRSMEPPARFKFKAPKLFVPQPEHPRAAAESAFMTLQDQLIARLRAADGLDLGRVKVVSPASRLLKISLGQVFQLTAAHERRHLYQARQLKSHTAFPRS
ncbi:MAG TPA: DinB family protein [Pyrinomonadaceae bacterium]|nr:DinB family protein [Pyrinomonadaceae bacterium]